MTRPARRYYGTARNAPTRPTRPRRSRARLLARLALAVVVVAALCVAVDRTWLFFTTAPGFAVSTIVVEGCQQDDGDELRVASGLLGQNVFLVDLEAARTRLRARPWIDDVSLRRRLPGDVLVAVVEARAEIVQARESGLALLDGRGALLEPDGGSASRLPRLVGASGAAARARGAGLAAVLRERAPEAWELAESVDVSRPDRLVLQLRGHPAIWMAGPESVDELRRYLARAPELERSVGPLRHVDVRWRDRLFLGRVDSARGEPAVGRPVRRAANDSNESNESRRKAGGHGT